MKQSENLGREYNLLVNKIHTTLKETVGNKEFEFTLTDSQDNNVEGIKEGYVICHEFKYPIDDLTVIDALQILSIVEGILIQKAKTVNNFIGI